MSNDENWIMSYGDSHLGFLNDKTTILKILACLLTNGSVVPEEQIYKKNKKK